MTPWDHLSLVDNSAPLLKDLSEYTMTEAKAALKFSVLFWKTSLRLFPLFWTPFMAKVIVRIFGTLLYKRLVKLVNQTWHFCCCIIQQQSRRDLVCMSDNLTCP